MPTAWPSCVFCTVSPFDNPHGDVALAPFVPPSNTRHESARWAEVITHTPCGNGSLAVTAELTNIDGVGSTLGYAGPSYIWATCPSISVSGEMVFDIDDIADLEADGIFEGVILHEMGHCIGIG